MKRNLLPLVMLLLLSCSIRYRVRHSENYKTALVNMSYSVDKKNLRLTGSVDRSSFAFIDRVSGDKYAFYFYSDGTYRRVQYDSTGKVKLETEHLGETYLKLDEERLRETRCYISEATLLPKNQSIVERLKNVASCCWKLDTTRSTFSILLEKASSRVRIFW